MTTKGASSSRALCDSAVNIKVRHPRESGDPSLLENQWIPAFAGMTILRSAVTRFRKCEEFLDGAMSVILRLVTQLIVRARRPCPSLWMHRTRVVIRAGLVEGSAEALPRQQQVGAFGAIFVREAVRRAVVIGPGNALTGDDGDLRRHKREVGDGDFCAGSSPGPCTTTVPTGAPGCRSRLFSLE